MVQISNRSCYLKITFSTGDSKDSLKLEPINKKLIKVGSLLIPGTINPIKRYK
jgi:hypothetical protein